MMSLIRESNYVKRHEANNNHLQNDVDMKCSDTIMVSGIGLDQNLKFTGLLIYLFYKKFYLII